MKQIALSEVLVTLSVRPLNQSSSPLKFFPGSTATPRTFIADILTGSSGETTLSITLSRSYWADAGEGDKAARSGITAAQTATRFT